MERMIDVPKVFGNSHHKCAKSIWYNFVSCERLENLKCGMGIKVEEILKFPCKSKRVF